MANSLSHGIGLAAALIATPYLIIGAARREEPAFVIGTIIFSVTVILLYLASTIYHALPAGRAKEVFRVVEHSAIFLLIAGTYTPFTLGILHGPWGWTLLVMVWSLAFTGVGLKVYGKASHPLFSTGLFLLMGWIILIAFDPLLAAMPAAGLLWLLAGGLSYTAGVAFFVTDARLPYGHLIWHLFVMAGTTCHYLAVLRYGA